MKKSQFMAIAIIIIIIAIMLNVNGRQEKVNDFSTNSVDSEKEITNTPAPTPAMVLTTTPTPIPMETTVPTPVASPALSAREEIPGETETRTANESNKTPKQEDKNAKNQTITVEDGEVIVSPGDKDSQSVSSGKSHQENPQQESENDFSDGSIELPVVVIGE